MHQRIAMDAFECRAGIERVLLLQAEEPRRLDQEERPQALAAAECRIAHRLHELRLPRGSGLARKQLVEACLDQGSDAFELLRKTHASADQRVWGRLPPIGARP